MTWKEAKEVLQDWRLYIHYVVCILPPVHHSALPLADRSQDILCLFGTFFLTVPLRALDRRRPRLLFAPGAAHDDPTVGRVLRRHRPRRLLVGPLQRARDARNSIDGRRRNRLPRVRHPSIRQLPRTLHNADRRMLGLLRLHRATPRLAHGQPALNLGRRPRNRSQRELWRAGSDRRRVDLPQRRTRARISHGTLGQCCHAVPRIRMRTGSAVVVYAREREDPQRGARQAAVEAVREGFFCGSCEGGGFLWKLWGRGGFFFTVRD